MMVTPTFQGEFQLAGWSESHNGGCKVTFWLPDSSDLDAFRALTVRKGNTAGHRMMAVLVEIGDDEQPVQPPPEEKPKGGELARWCGIRGNEREFWLFLNYEYCHPVSSAEGAAQAVREICEVESRVEFDIDPQAAARLKALIMGPFHKWCLARGVTA